MGLGDPPRKTTATSSSLTPQRGVQPDVSLGLRSLGCRQLLGDRWDKADHGRKQLPTEEECLLATGLGPGEMCLNIGVSHVTTRALGLMAFWPRLHGNPTHPLEQSPLTAIFSATVKGVIFPLSGDTARPFSNFRKVLSPHSPSYIPHWACREDPRGLRCRSLLSPLLLSSQLPFFWDQGAKVPLSVSGGSQVPHLQPIHSPVCPHTHRVKQALVTQL